MVALKRIRRLNSPNVAPDLRICDFFWLRSHDHSLTRLKINVSFENFDRQDFYLARCSDASHGYSAARYRYKESVSTKNIPFPLFLKCYATAMPTVHLLTNYATY